MIDFPTASSIILNAAKPLPAEWVALDNALGRYLASDIVARAPQPRFDASAVDGYAVHAADVRGADPARPVRLELAGTVRAGDAAVSRVKHGTALQVLTGGMTPGGSVGVVMQEFTKSVRIGSRMMIDVMRPVKRGEAIRRAGEEYAEGAVVMRAGEFVTPAAVGLLATLGYAKVRVHRLPRVAVVVTGNELRPLGKKLEPGEIYDSTAHTLRATLRTLGITDVRVAHAKDTAAETKRALGAALRNADVVLTAGGVSVGAYDFVKDAFRELGVRERFWGVTIRPGKPFYFGSKGSTLVFGLPGNPVSSAVTFHLLARPALMLMMGAGVFRPVMRTAVLDERLTKKPGRTEFVRGRAFTDAHARLHVIPTRGRESHMMGGLAAADCLIVFASDDTLLRTGALVEVVML